MFADRGERGHEGTSRSGRRQIGPTSMPDPRSSLMMWIGAWGGIAGVVVYNLAQSGEMLPVNRFLLAVDANLMITWLLILAFEKPGGRP